MTISQLTPAPATPSCKSAWPFAVVKLSKKNDIEWFREKFTCAIEDRGGNTDVKIEYLQNSDVYLCFFKHRPQGGFCINVGKSRYLEPFSNEHRQQLEEINGIDFKNCAEITLIWHQIPKDRAILRNIFFAASIYYALKKGKRYIMGGASNLYTFATYKLVLTKDLFRGVLKNSDGKEFESFLCFNSRFGAIISTLKCIFTSNTRPKKAIID